MPEVSNIFWPFPSVVRTFRAEHTRRLILCTFLISFHSCWIDVRRAAALTPAAAPHTHSELENKKCEHLLTDWCHVSSPQYKLSPPQPTADGPKSRSLDRKHVEPIVLTKWRHSAYVQDPNDKVCAPRGLSSSSEPGSSSTGNPSLSRTLTCLSEFSVVDLLLLPAAAKNQTLPLRLRPPTSVQSPSQ